MALAAVGDKRPGTCADVQDGPTLYSYASPWLHIGAGWHQVACYAYNGIHCT